MVEFLNCGGPRTCNSWNTIVKISSSPVVHFEFKNCLLLAPRLNELTVLVVKLSIFSRIDNLLKPLRLAMDTLPPRVAFPVPVDIFGPASFLDFWDSARLTLILSKVLNVFMILSESVFLKPSGSEKELRSKLGRDPMKCHWILFMLVAY